MNEKTVIADVKPEDVEEDVKLVDAVKDNIGTLVVERRKRQDVRDSYDVPICYKQTITVDGKKATLELHFERPSELNQDAYYPCMEWRLTQDVMDECDYWPEWKPFPVVRDGRVLRHESGQLIGQPVTAYHVIRWNVTECTDEENGAFFRADPVKGGDIAELLMTNRINVSSVGASRRRVGE